MKRFVIVSLFLALSILSGNAGKPDKKGANKKKGLDKQSTVIVSVPPKDTIKNNSASVLSEETIMSQKLKDTIAVYQDSISVLKRALEAKKEEYNKLLNDLDFADQCMMALAYRRCREPYDKKSVDVALTYFGKLHKAETKAEMEGLNRALLDYEFCNGEIHDILDKAQNDPDRRNLFVASDYKNKYIGKLKESRYFMSYMEKKVEYSIEYLDGIVNEALKLLSQHYSNQKNPADFSKLL